MSKYIVYLLGFFSFWAALAPAAAQVCDGNLGANIFTQGDFGSGPDVVLPADPGIAPGYAYTFVPPPNDGFYIITNDMTQWANNFDWLAIQDNSDDPQGYMMVVNASFEPGLFYQEEVTGLCENTLYAFSADIHNLIPPGQNIIRPNVSFLIDGQDVYDTGDIPENASWNTYGFTFTTEPGQTSVILALRNNAPGGIGNDLALDNISFRACGPEALILPTEIANICEDGSPIELEATIEGNQYDTPVIQWQQSPDGVTDWQDIPGETDFTYTHTDLNAGFYYYRYRLANSADNLANPNCHVFSNVKVVRVVPKFISVADTICEGTTYLQGNNEYSQTGTYVDSLDSFLGCDSIVTLELLVVPDPGIQAEVDINPPDCYNTQDGSLRIQEILNGAPPYAILVNGIPLPPGQPAVGLGGGPQQLLITDRFGCTLETVIDIPAPPLLSVDIGEDLVVDLGTSVFIDAVVSGPVINYTWEPPIDCAPDCASVEFLPVESGPLGVTVSDSIGCLAADSLYVEVNKVRKVYIPNAFTPNFDGINDYFTVLADFQNVEEVLSLQVYSRWGEEVYRAENFRHSEPEAGWDGTFRGRSLPTGIYTYVAQIRFIDGQVAVYSGDVTLLR